VKERSKTSTPVRDRGVRDSDVVQQTHDKSNLAKRVISGKEHNNGSDDDMNRIPHTREIRFAEER